MVKPKDMPQLVHEHSLQAKRVRHFPMVRPLEVCPIDFQISLPDFAVVWIPRPPLWSKTSGRIQASVVAFAEVCSARRTPIALVEQDLVDAIFADPRLHRRRARQRQSWRMTARQ